MDVAFSPCPNDTFLFHNWKEQITPHLLDIHHLNEAALAGKYPISKVSFFCLGHILEDYVMLPVGMAIGPGPKLVAKEPFPLEELSEKSVAIPGELTTAHLLLQLSAPEPKEKIFCLYHEVEDVGADCALIIHEQRFTTDWVEIADLGEYVPLGGIVAKRSLGEKKIQSVVDALQASLKAARANPYLAWDYIREHSQDKNDDVIQKHIDCFVNKDTEWVSAKGIYAVEALLDAARNKGLIPPSEKRWLF